MYANLSSWSHLYFKLIICLIAVNRFETRNCFKSNLNPQTKTLPTLWGTIKFAPNLQCDRQFFDEQHVVAFTLTLVSMWRFWSGHGTCVSEWLLSWRLPLVSGQLTRSTFTTPEAKFARHIFSTSADVSYPYTRFYLDDQKRRWEGKEFQRANREKKETSCFFF